ncbi:MAG TPA: hypothetical protein H9862_01125 [Candidatus Akkermansia intestinigallinarum]|uniref:Uncharacterized protein n=1 Tax=Candidatus Akkermansia intestinigallinarum TaxID=2838431 RepID=A0A9D1V9T4_9BACT|nr:hypothetical protein [Candidatus Akkermansia intestinigallinarum]
MSKVTLELTEGEMRDLAEMSAVVLALLGQVMQDMPAARSNAWQRLCVELLKAARGIPSIASDMEMNPECGYWYFRRPYVEEAYFSDLLDEYRDSVFWEELVLRVAQQSLEETMGREAVEVMSEDERRRRSSSMEKALWNEVTRHGIDRMLFMLPDNDA